VRANTGLGAEKPTEPQHLLQNVSNRPIDFSPQPSPQGKTEI